MESKPIDVGTVLDALETWIKQRPGLEIGNYMSDWRDRDGLRAYRQEMRDIGKDRKRALTALREVRGSVIQDAGLLMKAFKGAFSGRLSLKMTECPDPLQEGSPIKTLYELDYCTGQYWPTEYRKAAASVLEAYGRALARKWAAENPQTFTYRSMADVQRANKQVGGCWFGAGEKRFFGMRLESELIGGCYFITSEKMPDSNYPRLYSVWRADPDGSIDTVGEFQQYKTRAAAMQAIRDARQPIVTVAE
jgi:hypothetical protein